MRNLNKEETLAFYLFAIGSTIACIVLLIFAHHSWKLKYNSQTIHANVTDVLYNYVDDINGLLEIRYKFKKNII